MNAPMNSISEIVDALEAAAMQLPHSDRVHLAERLLASLDGDDEILAAWVVEAERRLDAVERGETHTIPIEEALAQARAGLRL
jgi:putative addiction module component (TIGR02574 family)